MFYSWNDADHTLPSSAEVKKQLSYASTHPMGLPGPVMGFPLFLKGGEYIYTYVPTDAVMDQ